MRIAIAGGTGTVGRHVVPAVRAAGHDAVVLTRSAGIDLTTGVGLRDALDGIDAVIDVTSIDSLSTRKSVDFFSRVTANLLAAEHAAGVPHHLALSIVGAAGVNSGHYAGKTAQEKLLTESDQPWSLLRTTQFHEFAPQMAQRMRNLGMVTIPRMRTQPVAAVEVASELAAIAAGAPRGVATDLAGPREENLADMVRRYLAATGDSARVMEFTLPGPLGAAMKSGALLPDAAARQGVQSFEEWLRTSDSGSAGAHR